MSARASLAFGVIAGMLGGCGLFLGLDARDFSGEAGGASSSSVTHGSTGGAGGAGGGPLTCTGGPCSDCILYVDPTAAGGGNGCSPTAPLNTITQAISVAKSYKVKGYEVHACAGSYMEGPLLLDYPVSLRGGYDCTRFERPPSFGYPNWISSQTIILPSVNQGLPETLAIAGIGGETIVDGLTVVAPKGGSLSYGVALKDASPTLADVDVIGGQASVISGGILVDGGTPTITRCAATGGTSPTSLGLVVTAGTPKIVENKIAGGAGADLAVGLGVLTDDAVDLTGPNSIEDNAITGGAPFATTVSYGVWVAGKSVAVATASIDLEGNTVDAGFSAGGLRGIGVYTTGKVKLSKNRVTGGHSQGKVGGAVVGVESTSSAAIELTNNMIHGGDPGQVASTAITTNGAVVIDTKGAAVLAHNTIEGGQDGLVLPFAVALQNGAFHIVNNVVASTGGAQTSGLVVAQPCQTAIVELNDNLFFDATFLATFYYNPTCMNTPVNATTISELEAGVGLLYAGAGVVVSGNRSIAGNCTDKCASIPQCEMMAHPCLEGQLFEKWGGNDGADTLMTTGWKLGPGVACSITQCGAVVADVPLDLYGTKRDAPVSAGAHERACP